MLAWEEGERRQLEESGYEAAWPGLGDGRGGERRGVGCEWGGSGGDTDAACFFPVMRRLSVTGSCVNMAEGAFLPAGGS